jgi:DNA-binding transcriptional LysR family regulator
MSPRTAATTATELRVLVSIAEGGSLGAAGRLLHLSQPTVSHHLAALEARLGGTLVERGATGSRLTELGRLLYPQMRALLDRMIVAEQEARSFAEHGTAVVTIGSFATAAAVLLPRPLAWAREHEAPFSLIVADPRDIAAHLVDHVLDIGLIVTEADAHPSIPDGVRSALLLVDPFLVILPERHPLLDRSVLALADLVDEPWITTTNDHSPECALLVRTGRELGREVRFSMRTTDLIVNWELVAAGAGLSVVPRLIVSEVPHGLEVRRVDDARFARAVHVAWHEHRAPIVRELVERIRVEAGALRAQAAA